MTQLERKYNPLGILEESAKNARDGILNYESPCILFIFLAVYSENWKQDFVT